MARLITSGFEWKYVTGGGIGQVMIDGRAIGTWTVDTTNNRPGGVAAASVVLVSGGATIRQFLYPAGAGSSGTTDFARVYFRKNADPGTNGRMVCGFNGQSEYGIRLNSDGTLSLIYNKVTVIGSASPVLTNNVWYRLELSQLLNAGTAAASSGEALLDGTQFATESGTRVTSGGDFIVGPNETTTHTGSVTFIFDDLAVNNSSGVGQGSYPGAGQIVLLRPISDNARGANWVAGAAGTTNLWDALNNQPPTGVALASATNTSQIKNVTKDTTGNYDANTATYTTAGIAAGDTINVVHPHWNLGASATSISHAMLLVSNPQANAGTETTFSPTAIAGTDPSNWQWQLPSAQVVVSPSVTLGTSPVIRVGKRTSSTSAAMCDAMGIYVDYTPAVVVTTTPPKPTVVSQAVNRASVW